MVNKIFLLISLFALFGLLFCGKQTTENQTTTINVTVDWGTAGAPAAGVIDSIKITVNSATSSWFATFPYSARKGSITDIPQNTSVTITVEGIKNPGTVVYHGVYAVNNVTDNMSVSVPTALVNTGLSPIVKITNPSVDTTVDSGITTITIAGTIKDTGNAGIDSLIINKKDSSSSMNGAKTTFSVKYTIAKDTDTVVVSVWAKGKAGRDTVMVYRKKSSIKHGLDSGLVAWYPFDRNANDASGNGNNGVVNGATLTTNRFGNANNAYHFDGQSNSITIPNNSVLQLTGSFTVSLFFKYSGTGTAGKIYWTLLNKDQTATGYTNPYHFALRAMSIAGPDSVPRGTVGVTVGNGTAQYNLCSKDTLNDS